MPAPGTRPPRPARPTVPPRRARYSPPLRGPTPHRASPTSTIDFHFDSCLEPFLPENQGITPNPGIQSVPLDNILANRESSNAARRMLGVMRSLELTHRIHLGKHSRGAAFFTRRMSVSRHLRRLEVDERSASFRKNDSARMGHSPSITGSVKAV